MQLNDVSFWYEGQKEPTLSTINLTIKPGEFLILCGASGCGKTTLTRVLNGLCPEFYPGKLAGTYSYSGVDMIETPLKEKSLKIGSVFQDPETQFFTTQGFDEIVLAAEQRAIDPAIIQKTLCELDNLLNLTPLYDRNLFTMSSGEKQKVAVASVCMLSPEVLVLDEPSANLDPESIMKLGEILAKLKEIGLTIVLSEHRFHYVKDIFDSALLLSNGEICERFTRSEILALSEEALFRRGLRSFRIPHLHLGSSTAPAEETMCEVHNLNFSFKHKEIFQACNLRIPKAQITAIMGRNGRGKTTLLRLLAGLIKPDEGEIGFSGEKVSKNQRIRRSFLLEQNGNNQLFSSQVKKEFLIDVANQDELRILGMLEELNLLSKQNAHPLALSGGQKQRLLVGISVLSGKEVLFLDEPTSGLDALNMQRISELLRRCARKGQTVVVVSHDTEFINRTADTLISL